MSCLSAVNTEGSITISSPFLHSTWEIRKTRAIHMLVEGNTRSLNHLSAGKNSKTLDTLLSLQGSWIINLEKLVPFINEVSTHSKSCQLGTVSLTGETYQGGLAYILSAKCSGCRMEMAFPTSSKVASVSEAKRWECNMAAVWGQMVTGGGHTPLAEAMSVLGVPLMSKKSFIAIEKEIGKKWWTSLETSMREAAEEEKRLAIERGSLHEGIPAITVIVDGGWCKQTHKHSYNAKSGVDIIIGLETSKLLYMRVRNKYYSTCMQAKKRRTKHHNMTEHYKKKLGWPFSLNGNRHNHTRVQRSRK